jgi:hypothetical protein
MPTYTDPYTYKDPGTPIFLLVTGQSNVQGLSPATTQFVDSGDPEYAHVWDFETINPYTGTNQVTDPTLFSWQHPDPAAAAVTDKGFLPYIGYQRGGTGHIAYAAAYELYRITGRDVYVLTIGLGGAAIKYWQADLPYVKDLLDEFVPYVLANTAALADVTAPDTIIWGQSEGNALRTAVPFYLDFLEPEDYKTQWQSVQADSYGVWSDANISKWYLMEATQYANWTGPGFGSPGDVSYDYPFLWDGLNVVATYSEGTVKLVRSVDITWETTGAAAYIHYDGDGLNKYGRRIAGVIMSAAPGWDTALAANGTALTVGGVRLRVGAT